MSVYWNQRVRGLSPYVPGEQPRDRKFIKLNTNENPYPPPPAVLKALQEAANQELNLYPDPSCTKLREEAASFFGVKPGQVFAGNGSDEVLAFAFAAFFESSPLGENSAAGNQDTKTVLFPGISYSFYPVYARFWNTPSRAIPLKEDFSIDHRDYLIPSGGAIIPNPNAPTGRGLPVRKLLCIAEYMEQRQNSAIKDGSAIKDSATNGSAVKDDATSAAPPTAKKPVLIIDEAYIAFSGEAGVTSAIPYIADHPNILVVQTLSKGASLAGLRTGFAIGSEELIEGLCRVRDSFNSYTLDRLAQAGAVAALKNRAYYNEINQKIIATRKRVSAALRDLGFTVIPSQANFIFVRHPAKSGALFFSALREKGILTRHFNTIADYLRVSIGSDADMDTFLAACKGETQ
ncbi:MAG: aminotransferase class I/II-fold pyridoxal phosphate-dependent enzyme [Spirochaetaceae bacterium]|jgi:histidinol-phosphate aminotransferase|nr:aminotransferase class I/II-fold pyridoxal phosphate-dependent enzyme [Spirochaetaceae bacterium]